ncbi:MAG: sortase domain-bontaining protein [Eubacterium sp.]
MRKDKASQKQDKADRKKYPFIDYIAKPIIFAMLAMIVVIPLGAGMLNETVDIVHDLQTTMTQNLSDMNPVDKFDKTKSPKELGPAMYIGTLSSKALGSDCKVYNGINRVSLRGGAAMSTEDGVPGSGKRTCVFGYANGCFANLNKVKIGDTITFSAYWGDFVYRVVDVVVKNDVPVADSEYLVLCTDNSSEPFSCNNGKALYVVAKPVVDSEEAQNE